MVVFAACLCGIVAIPQLLGLIPNPMFNRSPHFFRRLVRGWSLANLLAAATALAWTLNAGPQHSRPDLIPGQPEITLPLLLDSTSTLMWLLVAGVGWVICSFSVRYLDGDRRQGQFYKWTGFTLSSVCLTVLSGNLFLTVAAFLLTSTGLHFLLLHDPERRAARFPAFLKFVFSRLGDLCLLAAAVGLYREFGTADLSILFAVLQDVVPGSAASAEVSVAAGLIVVCAVLKSAQFPYHTWLPETLEAPTPVSALMHAGIVNAGGYLLIRTAPVLEFASTALLILCALGAITAFLAAMTMQWQTSIKRSLAWSTIAQMGFMMLQCGLGAFSAAMLHIIAHSLYKAHAFLNSGSVLSEKKSVAIAADPARPASGSARFIPAVLSVAAAAIVVSLAAGCSPTEKPGGVLLGSILVLGVVRWSCALPLRMTALLPAVFLCSSLLFGAYAAGFSIVQGILAQSNVELSLPVTAPWLLWCVALLVTTVFAVEMLVIRNTQASWYQRLYCHGRNGFYIDAMWRRLAQVARH